MIVSHTISSLSSYVRLIATDLEGTLLRNDKTMSARMVDVLRLQRWLVSFSSLYR